MRIRQPIVYLLVLTSAAAALFWAGADRRVAWIGPPQANAAMPLASPDIVGEWSGSWTDTVYAVSGAMNFTVSQDGDFFGAVGGIDVGEISPALGVLEGSGTGMASGNDISGQFDCANLGSGSFTVTAVTGVQTAQAATGSGSGTVVVPLGFGPFTFTGTIVDGTIKGSFEFTSPGGGKGVATMTRTSTAVQRTSWGALKSAYDE